MLDPWTFACVNNQSKEERAEKKVVAFARVLTTFTDVTRNPRYAYKSENKQDLLEGYERTGVMTGFAISA